MGDGGTEGIDATAVLGIAAKVEELFRQDGTYLTFPLVPLAYLRDDLRFVVPGGLDSEQAQALAEFAELVNRVPAVALLWQETTGERHLWDVYGDVLSAELAQSERTPEEEQEYLEAYAYLHLIDAEGLSVPSPIWLDYQRASGEYINAEAAYRAGDGSPEEAELKLGRDRAWQRWLVDGYKGQVEEALLTVSTLSQKDPSVAWDRYRTAFDPSLPAAFDTGPNGIRYAPSAFAPAAGLDAPWPRITLSRADLERLSATAPTGLGASLAGNTSSPVVSVGFDFSLVTIVRPWLDPLMFRSRAWRFRAGQEPLSDGADPPSGMCPAYVVGVVLARNIEVAQLRPAPGTETSERGPRLAFLEPVELEIIPGAIRPKPIVATARRLPPPVETSVVTAVRAEPPVRMLGSKVARIVAATAPGESAVVATVAEPPAEPPASVPVASEGGGQRLMRSLSRFDYGVVLTSPEVAQPTPPPPAPASDTEYHVITPPDAIYLMAFQCSLLPKAPDPDPSLSW